MTVVRLDLAYHGAGFAGWASQPGERTVQDELEGALEEVLGARPRLSVAGRTDAGVHAWAQVASFESEAAPPEHLGRALNALTGNDLVVWGFSEAPEGFDARRSARSRTYCYRLLAAPAPSPFERGLAVFWPGRLYPALLERCAEEVVGTHDFTAFTPTRTEHVRFERNVLRAEWRRGRGVGPGGGAPAPGVELFEFWIEAESFMRGMARALVGTMLEVASGRRPIEEFVALLGGAPREEAGDTARAHGLYLTSVDYGGPQAASRASD